MKKIINFAELSEQNKTQFLQFLLLNEVPMKKNQHNISKSIQQSKNRNENIQNSLNNKKISSKRTQPQKNKIIKNQRPIILRNKENNYGTPQIVKDKKINIYKRQDCQKLSLSSISAHTQKSNQSCYADNQQKLKNLRGQYSPTEQRKILTDRGNLSPKKCLKQRNIFEYKNQEKLINESFIKYLKFFDLKLNGIRPMKWPIHQLMLTLEQLQDQLFINISHTYSKQNYKLNPISQIIHSYILKKFKSTKLGNLNLINLLYNASYYKHNEHHQIYHYTLNIFDKIWLRSYIKQDIIYLLYTRNAIQKFFHINFVDLWKPQKKEGNNKINQHFYINESQIIAFLQYILGQNLADYQDQQLNEASIINQYKDALFEKNYKKNNQKHCYQILYILIEDFHQKRINDSHLFESIVSKNKKINIDKVNSIENQRCLNFWNCQYKNQKYLQKSLQQYIIKRYQNKLLDLIQLVGNQLSKSDQQIILKIIRKKSLNILNSLLKMNKMSWFQQLQIKIPSQLDISAIQSLQIEVNKLKQKYKDNHNLLNQQFDRQINKLCKQVLTVKKYISQLQSLINYFLGNTSL